MNHILKYRRYFKYIAIIFVILIGGILYMVSSIGNDKYNGTTLSLGNQDTVSSQGAGAVSADSQSSQSVIDTNSSSDSSIGSSSDTSTDDISSSDDTSNQEENSLEQEENLVYIYVCGAVQAPGVYECKDESRIYELIEAAGGFAENADTTYLNLVEKIKDGQKIYVPQIGEYVTEAQGQTESDGLININNATKDQLMTLPGIGEAKAAAIIESRETDGAFESLEDIMRISGIKESAYNKIKDLICIR